MGLPDARDTPEPAERKDIQQLDTDTLLEKLYEAGNTVEDDDLDQAEQADSNQTNVVEDQGQIKSMALPVGWTEAILEHSKFGIGSRSMREFRPEGMSDIKLGFFYRGLKISPEGGQAFHALLQSSPHKVSTEEISSVREALEDVGNPEYFAIQSANTEQLNGKSVLIIRGSYRNSENEILNIFVDSDGTGRSIQEIFYQAPIDQYPSYARQAKTAMKSIIWK